MQRVVYRPFNAALRGILFFGPAILLLVGIMNAATLAGWVVVSLAAVMIVVITFFSGVRIKASSMSVVIALVPRRHYFAWFGCGCRYSIRMGLTVHNRC